MPKRRKAAPTSQSGRSGEASRASSGARIGGARRVGGSRAPRTPASVSEPRIEGTVRVAPAGAGAPSRARSVGNASRGDSGASATSPKRRGGRRASTRVAPVLERTVRVRALDPVAKCGPATSVTELYRVDETVGGRVAAHLVFLDHHGWYCIHGRECRAVRDARRFGNIAR